MAAGTHPFPFRTRQLRPPAPMVLGGYLLEIGRRRVFSLRNEDARPLRRASSRTLYFPRNRSTVSDPKPRRPSHGKSVPRAPRVPAAAPAGRPAATARPAGTGVARAHRSATRVVGRVAETGSSAPAPGVTTATGPPSAHPVATAHPAGNRGPVARRNGPSAATARPGGRRVGPVHPSATTGVPEPAHRRVRAAVPGAAVPGADYGRFESGDAPRRLAEARVAWRHFGAYGWAGADRKRTSKNTDHRTRLTAASITRAPSTAGRTKSRPRPPRANGRRCARCVGSPPPSRPAVGPQGSARLTEPPAQGPHHRGRRRARPHLAGAMPATRRLSWPAPQRRSPPGASVTRPDTYVRCATPIPTLARTGAARAESVPTRPVRGRHQGARGVRRPDQLRRTASRADGQCPRSGKHRRVDELWEELAAASPSGVLVTEGRIVLAGSCADQGRLTEAIASSIAGVATRTGSRTITCGFGTRSPTCTSALGDLPEGSGVVPAPPQPRRRLRPRRRAARGAGLIVTVTPVPYGAFGFPGIALPR